MNFTKNDIIGNIVAQNYKAAAIFKKHEIDFCCQGNRTIEEVCNRNPSEIDSIINELIGVIATKENPIDFQSWPIELLIDYIEKKHHKYVENKTLEIKPYLDKICDAHGENHPEILEIRNLFLKSVGELAAHMKKEELILFPFIRKMVVAKEKGSCLDFPSFGDLVNPINMMKEEHNDEGEYFRKIASLSNQYEPPADACNSFRITYSLLHEFEDDLHLHIHLENNILFPKALTLEKEFHQ